MRGETSAPVLFNCPSQGTRRTGMAGWSGMLGSSVNRGVLNLEEFRTHTKFV
jgi:hypothetical protein